MADYAEESNAIEYEIKSESEYGSDALYVAMVVTDGGALNVRDKPNGKVCTTWAHGAQVQVLADEGEWVLAQDAKGFSGYVAKRYIRFVRAVCDPRWIVTDRTGHVMVAEGELRIRAASEAED